MVISPEHPYIEKWADRIGNLDAVRAYQQESAKKSDFERTELVKDKTASAWRASAASIPSTGPKSRFLYRIMS